MGICWSKSLQQGAQHHRQTSTGAKCRWNEHYITHRASRLCKEAQERQAPKQGPAAAQYRTSLHEDRSEGDFQFSDTLCKRAIFESTTTHAAF